MITVVAYHEHLQFVKALAINTSIYEYDIVHDAIVMQEPITKALLCRLFYAELHHLRRTQWRYKDATVMRQERIPIRICARCKDGFLITEFRILPNGRTDYCHRCQRAYRHQYYEKHKAKAAAASRAYYLANKTKMIQTAQAHYEANKAERLAAIRTWTNNNPAKRKAACRRYYLKKKAKANG